MPVAFVGDVHAGNHKRLGGKEVAGINQRCEQVLKAIERSLGKTKGRWVSLGDLFDTSNPTPQEIGRVASLLAYDTFGSNQPDKHVLLLGNHEMTSEQANHHSLYPLDFLPTTTVIEKPRVLEAFSPDEPDLVLIPFQPGHAEEWFPKACVSIGKREGAILCFHLGIKDETTPPYLENAHDAVSVEMVQAICAKYGYAGAIAGNWHSHKVWDDKTNPWVIQVGSLSPTGWDNEGLTGYGTVVTVTRQGAYTVHEVAGPRFVNIGDINSNKMNEVFAAQQKGCAVYVRVLAGPEEVPAVTAAMEQRVEQGKVSGFLVEVDKSIVKAEAKQAAEAAQSAKTLEEALSVYVEEMPLPTEVNRAKVLAMAARYVAAAGSQR